nr:hypothetical protein [Tanacetum cinerariifolium]
ISLPYWCEDCRLSESVNNHPNSVVALRRLRKLSDKIHGDVVPLPFRLSESVDNHPNSVIALRRFRKLSDKIHSDVVPLPLSLRIQDLPRKIQANGHYQGSNS